MRAGEDHITTKRNNSTGEEVMAYDNLENEAFVPVASSLHDRMFGT
jgi:hypothetical protein